MGFLLSVMEIMNATCIYFKSQLRQRVAELDHDDWLSPCSTELDTSDSDVIQMACLVPKQKQGQQVPGQPEEANMSTSSPQMCTSTPLAQQMHTSTSTPQGTSTPGVGYRATASRIRFRLGEQS